jgi:flagellar motor protein MotB
LYQAENAVQIAQSLGAGQFAPESYNKAVTLLSQARDLNARKMDTHAIVSAAREATQMAEDARTIALKRRDEERHQQELQQSRDQGELRRQAPAQTEEAQAERLAPAPPPPPPPNPDRSTQQNAKQNAQQQVRAQLFAQLNNTLATRDTPRGLVVTINDSMFEPGNGRLRVVASQPLANLAAILASHPGLRVRVEGYADSQPVSDERARAVQTALIVSGAAAPGSISAVGFGNTRPIAPTGTDQNRRVEVVIYGDSIGDKALWDHPYSLRSRS